MVQPFNGDPRQRDGTPNTTALGPDFPSSLHDLEKMSYRPSREFLRYVQIAVSNDDGSPIADGLKALLQSIDERLAALQALEAAQRQVEVTNRALVKGEIFIAGPVSAPGAGSVGGAYSVLDAIGTIPFSLTIPRAGIIISGILYDPSDQGAAIDLILFTAPPATQTDNGALSLTDAELPTAFARVHFTDYLDAANGQVAFAEAVNKMYKLPSAGDTVTVWGLLQALGTPTMVATAPPSVKLDILVE